MPESTMGDGAADAQHAAAAATLAPWNAYVLHRYDWSESSLILDLYTREGGRIAAAAKGAKRPSSSFRPVLLPFQALHVSLPAATAMTRMRCRPCAARSGHGTRGRWRPRCCVAPRCFVAST